MSSISSISLITSLSRPAAPYLQIADHYRELIATGVLRSGDRLPTVIQMATTWRVSPGTAHKAVRRLRGERSEERRVGKECRARGSRGQSTKAWKVAIQVSSVKQRVMR